MQTREELYTKVQELQAELSRLKYGNLTLCLEGGITISCQSRSKGGGCDADLLEILLSRLSTLEKRALVTNFCWLRFNTWQDRNQDETH